MSAFLVDKYTIDRIVTLIDHERRRSGYFSEMLEKELNIDFTDLDWKTKLGQKMWDLNQLALGYRYGDEEVKLTYVFSDVPFLLSDVHMYKSLRCWLYQCCEGDIPETSKLYRVFDEKITSHIANAIVQRLPEYDEAKWG
jgi:hypothetical protein